MLKGQDESFLCVLVFANYFQMKLYLDFPIPRANLFFCTLIGQWLDVVKILKGRVAALVLTPSIETILSNAATHKKPKKVYQMEEKTPAHAGNSA